MLVDLAVSCLMFCPAVLAAQEKLVPGEMLSGEITETAAPIESPGLSKSRSSATSIDFELQVEASGPFAIDLRSYFFDAYLVLRDADGTVLAENDNGLTRTHARIVIEELLADAKYTVQVCALDSGRGTFELLVRTGKPNERTREQDLMTALQDISHGLQVIEAANGPVHVSLLPLLDEFGELFERGGWLLDSVDAYARSLAIRTELLGETDPATVESMNIVGILHKDLGNFDQALAPLERVLAIRLESLGEKHQDTAVSQENLGVLYRSIGRLEQAEMLCTQAAATLEELAGSEHPETLVAKSNVASVLQARGKYSEAQPIFEEVLVARERIFGPTGLPVANTLTNLATLLSERGRYREGQELQARALTIFEAELGGDHPQVAHALNNLAGITESLGDSASARPMFERALEIQEKRFGEKNYYAAITLQNLGVLLASQGLLPEGKERLDQCVGILRETLPPDDIQLALALNNQGSILKDQGEYEPALATLREALQIAEKNQEPGKVVAAILSNMAPILRATGKTAEARATARRTLDISREVHGPDHVQTARYMSNLMVQLVGEEKFELGTELLEHALKIADRELQPGHALRVTCRANLASLYAERGEWKAAWKTVRASEPGDLQRIMAMATEEQSYRLLANHAWQLELEQAYAVHLSDHEVHARTYEAVLNWKGQVIAKLEANRRQIHDALTDEHLAMLNKLQALQSELSNVAFNTDLKVDERDARIDELVGQRKKLELRLVASLESGSQRNVTLAEVREALPDSAAILDFTLCRTYARGSSQETEPHVFAWVLEPGKYHPIPIDLGSARVMQEHVRQFLSQLHSASTDEQSAANSKLRTLLWDPLAVHLAEAELVFVSPDNFLGTLPFEAIELADGTFLLEQMAFVYTQNIASIVTQAETRSTSRDKLLCVGSVDFDRDAEPDELLEASLLSENLLNRARRSSAKFGSWQELPHSGAEARGVAKLHALAVGETGTQILLEGSEASEEQLKRELPGKNVVHIATHGYFRPKGIPSMWESAKKEAGKDSESMRQVPQFLVGVHPGLLAGLVCAGANSSTSTDRDDGYLTAEEIGWLDLSELDLIVLSACETGLGIVRTGEGLIGLRRAFSAAGANTVICSLWAIEDESTRRLMESFYEKLWKDGLGKLEALRGAQLEMLAHNREMRLGPRPETWAAFVLSGDWR